MTTTPRERPVNLRDWQARAALAGRLSQIWVPVRAAPTCVIEVVPSLLVYSGDLWDFRRSLDNPKAIRCPFGRAGDRLWGREAHAIEDLGEDGERTVWRLDRAARWVEPGASPFYLASDYEPERWRSAATMPRRASRLAFELLSVEVRQVHNATEADARACGVLPPESAEACPCQGQEEDPGPGHIEACPWRDVDYDPIGAPLLDEMAIRWNEQHKRLATWSKSPWAWKLGVRRTDA